MPRLSGSMVDSLFNAVCCEVLKSSYQDAWKFSSRALRGEERGRRAGKRREPGRVSAFSEALSVLARWLALNFVPRVSHLPRGGKMRDPGNEVG